MINSFFECTLVYEIQLSKRQYDLFPHLDNLKDKLVDADIIDHRDNRQLFHVGVCVSRVAMLPSESMGDVGVVAVYNKAN